MKFQGCLSCIVLYKEKMENNKLKRLPRQINYCRRTSFVGVPPLFGPGILKLILTVYLILMIFDNFVNSNICHGHYNVSCKTNNCSYLLNLVWKENKQDFKDATYYLYRHHCCNTFGCDKLLISQMERNSKKPVACNNSNIRERCSDEKITKIKIDA